MYFSKNSSWRRCDKNFGVKYPQEDPAKPSLRVNIPKDTLQAEAATSKLIHESASIDRDNFSVDNKSRSLVFKHPPLGPNLEKDILKTCSSDTQFPEDESLLGTNFGKEGKNEEPILNQGKADIPTTESLLAKKENEYCEGLKTPLNDQYLEEALATNYLNATATEPNNSKWEVKFHNHAIENQSSDADSKTLFIIIDVPENEEKTGDAYLQPKKPEATFSAPDDSAPDDSAPDDSAPTKSDLPLDKKQNVKTPKVKVNHERGPGRSPPRAKKDSPSLKAEGQSNKPEAKIKCESQDADDNPTYVLQLRFKKNFFKKSCRVGCVPEKEFNTRTPENLQSGTPIRVRESAPRKMLKSLTKEIATIEEYPELIRYSELKRLSFKTDNVIKSKLWTYGTFSKVDNSKKQVKNEVPLEPSPKKYLEPGTYIKASSQHQLSPKVQESNSESSLNVPKALAVQVQDAKSEGSLNFGQASQVQDSKIEVSLSHELTQKVRETRSEGFLNVEDVPQVQETKSESSQNIRHFPQVQETKPQDSLNVQQVSQVEETKPEVPLELQLAPQIEEVKPRAEEQKIQSEPEQQKSSDNSVNLQCTPQVQDTKAESSLNVQNDSQVERTETEQPAVAEIVSEPILEKPDLSLKETEKPKLSETLETSEGPLKVYLTGVKSAVDNQTSMKEIVAASTPVIKDSHPLQSKATKQKSEENKTNELKPIEKKIPMKKFDKKNWLEKKMRKPGKYAEFQFHSDSKSTHVPTSQVEKSESDITDFKTAPSEIKIVSEKGQNYYHTFSAAYTPLFTEAVKALRKSFAIKQESLFNEKWCTSNEGESKNFELNPKCLSKYTSPIFFSNNKEKIDYDYLLHGKKEVILNVGKSDMENTEDSAVAEDKGKSSVDGLTLMKKVKEIVDFDLNNAIKIFEGRDSLSDGKKEVSSVLVLKDGEWKTDTEELEKCEKARKQVTTKEIKMASFGNKKCGDGNEYNKDTDVKTDNLDYSKCFLPPKGNNAAMSKEDSQLASVITYNPVTNKFVVEEEELEFANQRSREFFEVVLNDPGKLVKGRIKSHGSIVKVSMKEGDSILVFDEDTQSWKVDFSILEKREEQMKQEAELRKASELILETFEKMEKAYTPNIPNPNSPEKRIFDYNTGEWKVLPVEGNLQKPSKSQQDSKFIKSKLPFIESDAEEIRKKNSDLYENLFVVKNDPKINKEKDLTKEEKGFDPIEKKKAKENDSGSGGIEAPSKEATQMIEASNVEHKDDSFWESFLKMDILPKTIWQLSKLRVPPGPKGSTLIVEPEPEPKSKSIKMTDLKFKIPIPFGGSKKPENPKKQKPSHRDKRSGDAEIEESFLFQESTEEASTVSPPKSDDSASKETEIILPKSLESVLGAQKIHNLTSSSTEPPVEPESIKYNVIYEIEKVEDSKPQSPPSSIEVKKVEDPTPKSSPPSVEAQQIKDSETKVDPFSVQAEKIENPTPNLSPPPFELKQVEDPTLKPSSPSVEDQQIGDPTTKFSTPSIKGQEVENSAVKFSPSSVEVQQLEDSASKSPPPSVESEKIEDPALSFLPIELKQVEDATLKLSPSTVEVQEIKDSGTKVPPPSVQAEKVQDSKPESPVLPAEAKQIDDPNQISSPPSIDVKKIDYTNPKTSVQIKKTKYSSQKASPVTAPVKTTKDSKRPPPSSVQVKKAEDSKPKHSTISSELRKSNDVKPKTPSTHKKIDDPKLKAEIKILFSEDKPTEDPQTKSSPVLSEISETDPAKAKSQAPSKLKKPNELTSKVSATPAEVKKSEDAKQKSFPSLISLQKRDVFKSSPTDGEAKKTPSLSKPSPLGVGVQKADGLKTKPSGPAFGAQKVDYPKSSFGGKMEDGSKSSATKKDKAAADHYISENILEMTRNSTKDVNSKIKPNKVETVKLNITTNKRPPLKITEINLSKQGEDKAKESTNDLKKPKSSETKNTEKCSIENNMFYKKFEKYKSPFSDPEYEEKPMKINSDPDGNPNLKKLDTWNKTLVLQDIVKPPENIESWLKDETDKMATLLLKVLQEAADGKPKRKPGKSKTPMDKLRNKANPYHNIRKKQEGTPGHFLIKVQTGIITPASSSNKPKPAEEKKSEKPAELGKDLSLQSGKMEKLTANPEKNLNSADKQAINLSVKESSAATGLEGAKTRGLFDPLVFSSGDVMTQGRHLSDISEDVPGPEILKKISKAWKVFPVLSTQITTFTLFSVYQLMRAGNAFFSVTPVCKHDQQPLSKLFTKYGPIVNVQGPLSGNIILINKPEHMSAVFEQDATLPTRSVFDSIEQSRRQIEGKINSIITSTDWSKPKWADLKRALNDPLEKGTERFFSPVEQAAEALIKNVRRNRNGQNYASNDFMEEIRSWSIEGMCNVLFEKSFSFLEGKSRNMNWMLEPNKLYVAVDEATDCLSRCEKGFHAWRLLPTSAFMGLGQAYLTLSTVLSKQLYQADLNLKNKHEILKDGILINTRDMTFMESMLLNDGMNMDEITCNLIDIMLIGINTMSSAMGFLLYDLSQNMGVQSKLLEELKELMSDKSSTLDYHKLHSLKYLQACVKESMRLHMPFSVLSRVLQNDILLSNYIVPKGTFVVMDTKVSCLREQNFVKPDEFIPDRWLTNEFKEHMECDHPFSFFPFCHGPRSDLAKRVVEMQLWACVAKVIRNFHVEYHHAQIEGTKNFISFPDKPLKFSFSEREE